MRVALWGALGMPVLALLWRMRRGRGLRAPPVADVAAPGVAAGAGSRRRRALRVGLTGLNWGSNLALLAVFAGVIAMLAAPQLFGWRYGILRSGSMSPAISTGAAIVVEPVKPEEIRTGDVITFRSAENRDLLITHRVLDAVVGQDGRPSFRTQGDANEAPDVTAVTSDRLIGRVVFDVPYVGQLVQHLRSPAAFVLLMVVPGVLIVLMELRELAGGVSDLQKRRKTAS